jgi:hypothetical protein
VIPISDKRRVFSYGREGKREGNQGGKPRRPFGEVTGWEGDMDRVLEDFFGRRVRPWRPERWLRFDEMEARPPLVDIFEEKDDIVVKAELRA